jgi:hypothetical protein
MNTLTKNRIIEKGDEFRHADGSWLPVPDKSIGLQIMFSNYKEVRRPSETPPSSNGNVVVTPIEQPEQGSQVARQESAKLPIEGSIPSPASTARELPTVVSRKAHSRTPLSDIPMVPVPATSKALEAHPMAVMGECINIPFGSGGPNCIWIGRNGTFNQTAINMVDMGEIIRVVPQGKRGIAKNAVIEFPKSIIPQLADWLLKRQ